MSRPYEYHPTKDGKLPPTMRQSDLKELFSSPVGIFLGCCLAIALVGGVAAAVIG